MPPCALVVPPVVPAPVPLPPCALIVPPVALEPPVLVPDAPPDSAPVLPPLAWEPPAPVVAPPEALFADPPTPGEPLEEGPQAVEAIVHATSPNIPKL
jgi:FHA domain-containing protein